jgi:predicted acyltransferase
LVSGAYSFLMLAVFYWIIDVRGKAAWSFPFRVIGMNAVFAYLASRTVFPWKMEMNFLFGGVMSFFPPEWGAFVGELLYVAVYWLLLLLMYRKGIFLKA